MSINDHDVFSANNAHVVLATLRDSPSVKHLKLVFAPEVHIPSADRIEPLSLDLNQLRSITVIRLEIGAAPQTSNATKTMTTVTDESIDDTNLLVHALSNKILGSPDEQAVGRFTRWKLRKLSTWPIWLQAEFKQLDAMLKQGMYGEPVEIPLNSIVLRQHWTYLHKADGTRKARNCCDDSERAAPELHAISQTYLSL
jgi:hypothetical protein